jgi:hypothetical protein
VTKLFRTYSLLFCVDCVVVVHALYLLLPTGQPVCYLFVRCEMDFRVFERHPYVRFHHVSLFQRRTPGRTLHAVSVHTNDLWPTNKRRVIVSARFALDTRLQAELTEPRPRPKHVDAIILKTGQQVFETRVRKKRKTRLLT